MVESIPLDNFLLASLSNSEYDRLVRHLVAAWVVAGERLFGPEHPHEALHFISSGLTAVTPSTQEEHSAAVALIGNEGVIGLGAIIGARGGRPAETISLTPVTVWTLGAEHALQEFKRGGRFQRNLLRFGHALSEQIARTALCNRQHPLDGQLGRWLLVALDRLPGNTIPLTHATIARTMGVRRASVSEAAARLEGAGLIEQSRGAIRVPDRPAFEHVVCDCYREIRAEYDALARIPGNFG